MTMNLSKSKFNLYASLGSAKMRKRNGLFCVEGMKSVSDTLHAFEAEAFIFAGSEKPEFIPEDANVFEVSREQMSRLSSLSTPSDVMAVYKMPQRRALSDFGILSPGLYMLLDGVQDPGNLGTIIRTCHWFGIFDIFASFDTVDVFNPKTVQSSMGSIASVNVTYCDLCELIQDNKRFSVFGTLLDGDNIYNSPLDHNGFIVMGNEGKGISEEVRRLVTNPISIPPASDDHSESLNVAIAAAITLSQFEQRKFIP